jgi:hypothetical protein
LLGSAWFKLSQMRKYEVQKGIFESQVALPSAGTEPDKFDDKVLEMSSIGV